jgi:hypothetical protein
LEQGRKVAEESMNLKSKGQGYELEKYSMLNSRLPIRIVGEATRER